MNYLKVLKLKMICLNLLLSILILNSCKKEKIKHLNIVIDISKTFQNKQKINLSTIAAKIEYIQLQGDSTCYLGQIYYPNKSIKFFNDKILVRDAGDKLLLFNTTGKFLNKIGNVGRGPQEYARPDSFTFLNNDISSLVAVFSDTQRKTFLYNINGKYIADISIDFWPTDLTSINNSLVFVNSIGSRKPSDYYCLSIVSIKGNIKKRLFYKEEEKRIEKSKKLILKGFSNSYTLDNTFHYWESDYDTIWRITDTFIAEPKYVIDIGSNRMPIKEQTGNMKIFMDKSLKYNSITNLKESTKYFFISTVYKKRIHQIYYDKNTKESSCVEFKKEFGKGINFSFYNDIDGGMPFWPQGQVSDNKMFKLIYGYELKEYLDRKGDDVEVLDKEAREKLLQLAENSKVSDNPILMIVTLKQ